MTILSKLILIEFDIKYKTPVKRTKITEALTIPFAIIFEFIAFKSIIKNIVQDIRSHF